MSWLALRFAVLALGFAEPPGAAAPPPERATVAGKAVDVFDEPDDRSLPAGRLVRGDRVEILGAGPAGWLVIAPPPGSFDWIEESAIRTRPGGTEAEVDVARTGVRVGHPAARMPGGVRASLSRGAVVRLADHPPLSLGRGSAARTWRAIAPAPGDVRYLHAEALNRRSPTPTRPEAPAETRASFVAPPTPSAMPASISSEVTQIESTHRAILRQPIGDWRLDPIRQRYTALMKDQAADPQAAAAIKVRLDVLDHEQSAAESVRKIEAILERCRTRERNLDLYRRRIDQAEAPTERPYLAKGLMQPTSRWVDGQKVFALIGSEGTPVAYLRLPAGLDPTPVMLRRVGVRGSLHYDEQLRARLIHVHDLDPIDDVR